jgi:hypothetical protein
MSGTGGAASGAGVASTPAKSPWTCAFLNKDI